jgi:3(or 17)beta-hydroxysteroid dehydrogenase
VLATIEETTLEQWRAVQAVNSDGVFLGCKHAIPALLRSGGGSIVNLSSTAGLVGTPAFAAYAASKGAVRSLTKTVAVHCAQRGYAIRCNSIHPGGIDTPMTQALGALAATATPLALEALSKQPLPRLGKPEDVAELVLYLASDASSLVNGAEIAIDAGLTAG